MLGLSTKLYDDTGNIILDNLPTSDIDTVTRRVTKTKTLDGDVSVEDRGYTAKDRAFVIRVNADYTLRDKLLDFIRSHSELMLTTVDGGFDVIATTFDLKQDIFILTFEAR